MSNQSSVDNFSEKRLLQTLFYQPEFLDDKDVNEDIFSSLATRNIYKSLIALKDNAIPFTRDALLQEYAKVDLDASQAVVDVITEKQHEPLETIKDIIEQLNDAKKRRSAAAHLKAAIKKIEDVSHLNENNTETISKHISDAEASLKSDDSSSFKKVMNFEEWSEQYNKELNLRKMGKQFYFYNFMFDELIPDGPRPGEIGIIASSPGSGKSTLALNLVNSLIEVQVPSMYFSLEMSSIATMDRLLSKRLEVEYSSIINPSDQGHFEDLCSRINMEQKTLLENKKFRFSEDASMSIADLKSHIQKFQADLGQKYCIVVLDLLSMITDFTRTSGGANFAQSIEIGMNELSSVAKELGVHIIGVLQVNRGNESETKCYDVQDLAKFRPTRAQIKNANAWVERARYVVMTFREKMYAELFLEPEQHDTMLDIIECQVVKINNGKIGKISKGLFNSDFFSIDPIVI